MIYISTTFIKDSTSLYKALNKCKDAGIKSVEIGSNHCYEKSYDYCLDFSFQYLVHNYFPIPEESFVINIASFDDKVRNSSIAHIKNAIDFCVQIGAKLYTFHPGFLTDPQGSNKTDNNYDFQWDENQLQNSNYEKAKNKMYDALYEIVNYAQSNNIPIAIETEGSLTKKNHLLMQRPEEYEALMKLFSNNDLGINLNIGHLNLAANAFDFDRYEFVNLIQDYIIAMELSHNDGLEDQHRPLESDGWYWDIILDSRFRNSYKILEFRNTSIELIIENINLLKKKTFAI
tara:strand:- start:1030 stop:1893 length:864 start_codon:yes stop_codon:yes gene_type:complete